MIELPDAPYTAMGVDCQAHHHHSSVPIERHHVWPLGDGGPNIKANIVPLCANAHGLVHYLIDLCRKHGSMEAVPWEDRRHFGVTVRKLAALGWDRIQRQAM